MPSRFEGLPLAVIEAMLCGRPGIATDVGGHSEVIEDYITGFLAQSPTSVSMSEAIERFWTRRHDSKMLGEAGLKRIRNLLPPDPVQSFSDELTNIYESLSRQYQAPKEGSLGVRAPAHSSPR